MSDLQKPRAKVKNPERLPDEIDDLLRSFYAAQMPSPWPVWQPPAATQQHALQRVLSRSRLALAASVALFFGGAWALSGMQSATLPLLENSDRGTNTAQKINRDARPTPKYGPANSASSRNAPEKGRLSSGARR